MRHTPLSLILSAAALLGCSLASAQTLTIDNITTNLQNLSGQASVTIDPVSGNVVVKSASGSACSASPQPTASVTGPSTAESAQVLTINWSSTNTSGNACVPSSNPINNTWNSPNPSGVSGSRQVTMPVVTSGTVNQALTMTCSGGAGTTPAVSTLNVTVRPITTAGCEGTPSDGLFIAGNPSAWGDLYPGSVFPQPFGNAKAVSMQAGQAVAIAFTTGTSAVNASARFETSEASGLPGNGMRLSVSRCAGDYREILYTNQRCATRGESIQQSLNFLVGGSQVSFNCALLEQTQYYLNMTFKVLAFPPSIQQPSDCSSGSCTALILTRANTRLGENGEPLPDDDI